MPATFRPSDLVRLRTENPDVRVIDVRTPGEFADGHIAGSYNVPLPDLTEHREEFRAASGPVVLVCQSGRRAAQAESTLSSLGWTEMHVLDGGLQAWHAAALPVSSLHADNLPWALERQVRLVAGGIVATAIAASMLWPPARFVAGAAGTGLVLAALTNSCLMGGLLARLPYNRTRAGNCDMPTLIAELTSGKVVSS
ncbi:MAG TPA: rhodanese-like domain-containing protein [Ilumatobacter sp.]|nr:rhodanese-like domain-containing protein [Ilumatobacter sp.]